MLKMRFFNKSSNSTTVNAFKWLRNKRTENVRSFPAACVPWRSWRWWRRRWFDAGTDTRCRPCEQSPAADRSTPSSTCTADGHPAPAGQQTSAQNAITPIDYVVVLRPTRHKIAHFGDVFPSQYLGFVWKKLNLTTKACIHQSKEMYYTQTHTHLTALFRDYPGKPVPVR